MSEILEKLKSVEKEQGIRIRYACESGSRAWGFPSPDSDYDVRFLYTHPLDWYLTVEEDRDVSEIPMEGLLDVGGWELRKALRLAKKSNPVLWEWFQSPTVYLEEDVSFRAEIREAIDPYYSLISAANHYLALCKGTMERELSGPTVKIKKYFYMLRPILAAKWIVERRTIPPMEFEPLVVNLVPSGSVLEAIRSLEERKRVTDERVGVDRIPFVEQYLEESYVELKERSRVLPAHTGVPERLDAFLRSLLLRT